jgi:hypothetical protein
MSPHGLRVGSRRERGGGVESTKGTARGILAIWNDIRPGTQREYEAWYRGEHLPERLSIPGFRAGWRFRAIAGEPEYFTFYETTTPEVLFSEAYEARVNDPTPLTRSIMSGVFTNATRALLTSVACWGMLRGAFAVSLRLDAQPGSELERSLRAVAAREDVLRAELWMPTRPEAPAVVSAEQQLRGPDKNVTAAAVVETLTEQEGHAVAAVLRDALGMGRQIGVYRLFCVLDREDLGR